MEEIFETTQENPNIILRRKKIVFLYTYGIETIVIPPFGQCCQLSIVSQLRLKLRLRSLKNRDVPKGLFQA